MSITALTIAEVKTGYVFPSEIKYSTPAPLRNLPKKLEPKAVVSKVLSQAETKLFLSTPVVEKFLKKKIRKYKLLQEQIADPHFQEGSIEKVVDWIAYAGPRIGRDYPLNIKRLKEFLDKKLSACFSFADHETSVPIFTSTGKLTSDGITFPAITYMSIGEADLAEHKGKIEHKAGDDFQKGVCIRAEMLPKMRIHTKEQADAIVKAASSSRTIPWRYYDTGCSERAFLLVESLKLMGIDPTQIFLQYHFPKIGKWEYHVAVAIKLSSGEFVVLDPSLNPEKSMGVSEWIRLFNPQCKGDPNYTVPKAMTIRIPKNDFTFYCPSHLAVRLIKESEGIIINEVTGYTKYNYKSMYLFNEMCDLHHALVLCGLPKLFSEIDTRYLKLLLTPVEFKLHLWAHTEEKNVQTLGVTPDELMAIDIKHLLKFVPAVDTGLYFENLEKHMNLCADRFIKVGAQEFSNVKYLEAIKVKLVEIARTKAPLTHET